MVLKRRPGIKPEGPRPLRLHRNCAICSTRRGITLFNLGISYHHDDNLAAMFFIEGYGSETAGPRRGGLSRDAALIAQHPHACTFSIFFFFCISCCVVFSTSLSRGCCRGKRLISMYFSLTAKLKNSNTI